MSYGLVHLFFRLHYDGLEHVPQEGPLILVANHTSFLDMFAIHVKMGRWVSWVAKKELFQQPLLAWLLTRLGCIPVSRDKVDLSAARGIMTALKEEEVVGLFPQGTRVKPHEIAQVLPRNGAVHFALKTQVPVLPVAIEGSFRLFSRIRVVFGQPFCLEKKGKPDARQLDRLSLGIMQRVYDLIGMEDVYRLGTLPEEAAP